MVLAGGPDFPVPSLVGPNISTMSYVVRTTISSSEVMPPLTFSGGHTVTPADLSHVRWVSHCRDLVQLPVAA